MSGRPLFVPRNKRRQKKPYFHGAFTGGFSAGYYNTVGSKEGWTPSNQEEENDAIQNVQQPKRKPKRVQQRKEDFMDEDDHNQWGGPSSVKREYDDSQKMRKTSSLNDLERVVASTEPPQNVGLKLLRVMGWRDGSATAIVPLDGDTDAATTTNDALEEQNLLSAKKLKRIRLQQSRVHIPTPKLDVCGIGFSPHRDAPEFQRHMEKRKKLAQQRARAATGSGSGHNTYRMSSLLDTEDNEKNERQRQHSHPMGDDDNHNVSYETVEDFIGSRTVGGFALREDEDDVYDDNPSDRNTGQPLKVDDDEYDTVLHDHHSDEEEGDGANKPGDDFGGVFASWASLDNTAKASSTTSASKGVTSDGRPPLAGFVLGSSTVAKKETTGNKEASAVQALRYAGPDVPFDYTVKRHEFGEDEHPALFGDMSRVMQRETLVEQKHAASVQSLLPATRNTNDIGTEDRSSQTPMAGSAFSGLAIAMKNRFTTGDSRAPTTEGGTARPVGLHVPTPGEKQAAAEGPKTDTAGDTKDTKEAEIVITRTVQLFVPTKLLCKRFHVAAPSSTVLSTDNVPTQGSEAEFFKNEILNKTSAADRERKAPPSSKDIMHGPDEDKEPPLETENRPSMDVFKSIFEPDSASSESDEESHMDEIGDTETQPATANETDKAATPSPPAASARIDRAQDTTESEPLDKPQVDNESDDKSVEDNLGSVEQRKRRRKRRHRSNSHDSSSVDSSVDSYKRRKRKKKEKRRKHEKKRRKKHKSSSKR